MPGLRRFYESDSVALGMLEVFFGATVGVVIVAVCVIWWRLERNSMVMKHQLESSLQTFEHLSSNIQESELPSLEDIREELADLIQETIGSMRTPQIADHIGAALSQWAQVKLHKEMQSIQNTANMLQESPLGDMDRESTS